MGGCVETLLRFVETPLSPRVMKAPCAQSRRHLRVAFVFGAPMLGAPRKNPNASALGFEYVVAQGKIELPAQGYSIQSQDPGSRSYF